ncbi:HIT family protein [Streptomyces sp. NPDC051453]|uniref:HIT family protein n=1 Tax=Streptomyces sp. NPDC051453 TaxID=3154941 RepID=UPI0034296B61
MIALERTAPVFELNKIGMSAWARAARLVAPVGQGRREVTSEALRVSDCVFCRIGRDEIDEGLVAYRSEIVFVVPALKQRPNNPGHALVLSVSHVTGLHELPVDLLHEIFEVTARVASALKDAYGGVGSTVTKNNHIPGQVLHHVHVHLVPRFAASGVVSRTTTVTDWSQ